MTADELEEWLKGESSTGSGWSKDDGAGETVGHKRCDSIVGPSRHLEASRLLRTDVTLLQRSQDHWDPWKET